MTPQSAKAKGRAWETACALWLIDHDYYPDAERRRLEGVEDRGDLAGIPGTVIECKNERTYHPQQWLREAEVERLNDGAPVGAVWFKFNGKPNPGDGAILLTPAVFFDLLRRAGHVPAPRWND